MSEFIPYRFEVNLLKEDDGTLLCSGLFSEVQGLEFTMEPRAIQVGGQNWGEVQRAGITKFSPIVLKRGVTQHNDLWSWFDTTTRGANYGYRLQGKIDVLGHRDSEGNLETVMTWKLGGVLPTQFKGSDLSSTANQVAVEEITLVIESLTLSRPGAAGTQGGNS